MTPAALHLRDQLLRLWTDHVVYTRNYLISVLANLPETNTVVDRLMANQDAIASAFGNYYGQPAAMQISQLLREHISIAAKLVDAVRAQNYVELDAQEKAWSGNANQMAEAFASLNPYWPVQMMSSMLHEHLRLTTEEIKSRLRGDWAADEMWFDQVLSQALAMADTFATGIYRQFPQAFGDMQRVSPAAYGAYPGR